MKLIDAVTKVRDQLRTAKADGTLHTYWKRQDAILDLIVCGTSEAKEHNDRQLLQATASLCRLYCDLIVAALDGHLLSGDGGNSHA